MVTCRSGTCNDIAAERSSIPGKVIEVEMDQPPPGHDDGDMAGSKKNAARFSAPSRRCMNRRGPTDALLGSNRGRRPLS